MSSCPTPKSLTFTLPNHANTERFGVVSDSTPEACLPHSLVGQTVTAKASNLSGTFSVDFPTEITDAVAGQFKIFFNLADEPMLIGSYVMRVTVRDSSGTELKTMNGALNIQPQGV